MGLSDSSIHSLRTLPINYSLYGVVLIKCTLGCHFKNGLFKLFLYIHYLVCYHKDMRKKSRSRTQAVDIAVNCNLQVAIFKEGRHYIAYAPSLDMAAQGHTLDAAQKNFQEVFEIYLEETLAQGTLVKDLRKHGWRKRADALQPPPLTKFPQKHIGTDVELKAFAIVPFPKARNICRK